MDVAEIQFGGWLPDQADYKNPGLVEANNCFPSPGGFGPFSTAVATTETTTETVAGAQRFFRNDGTSLVVGGSATRLFTRTPGTITETTGLTSLGVGSYWRFERFNDLVIAVSRENAPQYLDDIDTDTTFSALPGSPPKAAVVGKVLEWLVLGDLVDIAGLGAPDVPYRVRWGAFNNPTEPWVTDRGQQSDFRDLDRKYGRITGIVGGRFGLVFQERAIWRMVFVGAPKVFDFELVTDARGCIAPGSLVTIGYQTYFLDRSGFFVTNGSDVQEIGDSRVNEWFGDTVDGVLVKTTHGTIDWTRRCIVWSYPISEMPGFARQLLYSFVTDGFTTATQPIDYLIQTSQDALNLSDLAAMFPGGLGDMSAFSIGTLEWKARGDVFGAFVPSGAGSAYATFTGPAARADFVTGDFSPQPGRRTMVDGINPIVELQSGEISTSIRSRALQGQGFSNSAPATRGADGYCPQHVDNWFHSVRTTIPAGSVWDKATGFWARYKVTGRR